MQPQLIERCLGRWTTILPLIGLDRKFLSSRHGPCPMCGGKDRFRFDNKQGTGSYYCSQCGPGYGMTLVIKILKTGFRGAAERVEEIIRDAGPLVAEKKNSVQSQRQKAQAMKNLWERAAPLSHDCPGGIYLRKARGLALEEYPSCLRFVPDAPYDDVWRDRTKAPRISPAIVAKVVSAADKAVNLHRIFITPQGRKAAFDPPRKLMPGSLPAGAAIRLFPFVDTLGVAEGVETALAAFLIFGVPTWAALTAGGMERFVVPPGVKSLWIFADNDANFQGAKSAYALGNRVVIHDKISTTVEIPSEVGADWNDSALFHVERETAA